MDYCGTCGDWVDDFVLEQTDPGDGEVIRVCGWCGSEVTTHDEDRMGWEFHPPY